MPQTLARWAALCFALAFLPEASSTALRARRADDDGDDDGGAGGLAGALGSLFGGGGGGGEAGGADDGDDSDPNMVGGSDKKGKGKGGKKGGAGAGVDLSGLEKGLMTGGVGQLTQMLSAMRAAQSPADTHIKKMANGEEMYDFRDLDDGTTTPMPEPITMKTPTLAPPPPAVPVPAMPANLLPGKGGKMPKGLMTRRSGKGHKGKKQLVVWPPAPPAPKPVAQAPQPLAQAPPPVMAMAPPVAAAMVAPQAAPGLPPANAQAGLYQGLAAMRQNLDNLLNQAAGTPGAPLAAAPVASAEATAPLEAKIDEMTQNFNAQENKMEQRVETLETENAAMKKQLDDEGRELKALQTEAKENQALRGEVRKAMNLKVQKANATSEAAGSQPPAYATKPWDATFTVHLDGKADGKKESFTVRVHPEWAPEGAKRFQDIVQAGILNDARFFRVVPGFMVQFGIPGAPKVAANWEHKRIQDDPVKQSNKRGTMTFATSGPNTRTTQMFVNYVDNAFLDKQNFSPFAEVIGDGMSVVDKIQSKYKEKPNQGKIQHHGNKYLTKHFPDLSFVDHVESSLTSAPKVTGFLQDSETPAAAEGFNREAYRYGGIATFFHHKTKVGI